MDTLPETLPLTKGLLNSPYNVSEYTDLSEVKITPALIEFLMPVLLQNHRYLGQYIPICGNVAVKFVENGLDAPFPYGSPPKITDNVGYGCVNAYDYTWPRITDAGEQRIIDGVIYRWDAYQVNVQNNENAAWSGLTSMLSVSLDGVTWMRVKQDEEWKDINYSAIVLAFTIDRDNWFGKGRNMPIQLKMSQWYNSRTGRINSPYDYIQNCPFSVTYNGKNYAIDDQKMYWTTDKKLLVVGQTNDYPALPNQGGYCVVTWGTDPNTWTEPKTYIINIWGVAANQLFRTECPSFLRLVDKVTETLYTYCFINGNNNENNFGYSAWSVIEGDAISNPDLMDKLLNSKFTLYAFGNMEYAMCATDRVQNDGTGGTLVGTTRGYIASGRYSWAVENHSNGYISQLQFGTSGGSWWDSEVESLLGLPRFLPNSQFKSSLSGFQEGTWVTNDLTSNFKNTIKFDQPKKRLEFNLGGYDWTNTLIITFTDAQGNTRQFEAVAAMAGAGPADNAYYQSTCLQLTLTQDDLKNMWDKQNNIFTRLPIWNNDKLCFQIDNGWLMLTGERGRLSTCFGFGEGIIQIDVETLDTAAIYWSVKG